MTQCPHGIRVTQDYRKAERIFSIAASAFLTFLLKRWMNVQQHKIQYQNVQSLHQMNLALCHRHPLFKYSYLDNKKSRFSLSNP